MEKDKIIEKLREAIDAENTLSFCTSHLAALIKNGRIKDQFRSFSKAAKANKDSLTDFLKKLDVKDFVLEDRCRFCRIKAESFSLVGAINLGLEITNTTIKLYKDLSELSEDSKDKIFFKKLLKEKAEERNLLEREKGFVSEEKSVSNFIDYYCMPEVISKLWR